MPGLLAMLVFASVSNAQEIQVKAGGDIGRALAGAARGATITLEGGAYAPGQLSVGSSAAGITLRSRPGARAVLDFGKRGGFYIKADGFTLKDLDVLNAKNFGIDIDASNVTVDGCKVLGSGGDAIKLSPGNWRANKYNKGATIIDSEIGANGDFEGIDCVGHDDVRIINCYIHDTPGWGVYLKGGATNGLIEGCLFVRCGIKQGNPKGGACLGEHTGPDEVMTTKHGEPWESVNCTVRNNIFVDIPSAAMAAWCAKGARFVNNTCVDVATRDRAAVIVLANHGLGSRDVAFVNNIVVGSTKASRPLVWIYSKGASGKITFDRNCWFGGNGRFWDQAAGGPVSFDEWKSKSGRDANSLFADPKLDDGYHLRSGSPCIDRGLKAEGFTTDFDGGTRTGAWDIGADEYGAGRPRKVGAAPPRPAAPAPAGAEGAGDSGDYAAAMKKVAARFKGKAGVVIHIGDSITYANGYSQWARFGKGKTDRDRAICRWMHTNRKDDTDGWYLCSVDRPGMRSETAVSGIRSNQFLAGGKSGIPPLKDLVRKYNPQMAVVMLGTNDASAGRSEADFRKDMSAILDLLLANGTIPILSTIPPHPKREALARAYNEGLRSLARSKGVPLIDFEREILERPPNDWNGTLLGKNDVHPSSRSGGASPAGEPTEENLRNSGLLLRGWLSVRKVAEVKERVLD